MEDFYGTDLDYIHLKFGRMQKCYNFTDKFRESHPNFCAEYEKYWNGEDGLFKTPLDIAQYVDVCNVPVRFYYNYTDTPSKDITDVYEYILREFSFGTYHNGEYVGLDGEKQEHKSYKVVRETE